MSPADDPAPRRTRRWFLAGGVAAVLGGGAGVGAGLLRRTPPRRARPAPAALVAAADAETALLALAADAARDPALRVTARALTVDHTAHLHALQAALSAYDRPTGTSTSPATTGSASPTGSASGTELRARLRAAEQAAATSAATRATQLGGSVATLLAGISACESTHVELLA